MTTCTGNRVECFGVVNNRTMVLNDLGKIAEAAWVKTPMVYKNVDIDEFVIMPNHMHGIVIIKPHQQARGLHYSLSQIVGSYKNSVTKLARQLMHDFSWQPSFYDHVIRKDESLEKIREYIRNNPLKWELDRNNPANLWM